MKSKKDPNRYTINALDKSLDLIELLAEGPLNLLELVEKLNQPKSSIYRIITTFEERGYITREEEEGKYCLGLKTLELTKNLLEDNTLVNISDHEMRKLADITGESVNLGVLLGENILYVAVIDGTHPLRFIETVGSTGPVQLTAIGKALASNLTESQLNNMIKKLNFTKATPQSKDNKEEFLKELQLVKQRGYALDDEEMVIGARCIAAPIFNMFGNVEAAMSISGAAHRLSDEKLGKLSTLVIEAANNISKRLGYK